MTHTGTDRSGATGAGALHFVRVASTAIVRSGGFVEFLSQAVGHLLNVTGSGDKNETFKFVLLGSRDLCNYFTHP